jgi:hypothetical protein
MKMNANAMAALLLASLLVGAGCAHTGSKGPAPQPTNEVVSDSWIATKLKGEQVKGAAGVVTADSMTHVAVTQDPPGAKMAEVQSVRQPDSDAEFGRRSLPFFPVFAIRPW